VHDDVNDVHLDHVIDMTLAKIWQGSNDQMQSGGWKVKSVGPILTPDTSTVSTCSMKKLPVAEERCWNAPKSCQNAISGTSRTMTKSSAFTTYITP